MESLCRLCGKEKPTKQLAYNIDDETLNIESKLIYCCGWNFLIPNEIQNDELPKKVCRVCIRRLESSWAFAEIVAQAQEQLCALIADIKPVVPIIEYVNGSGEIDETNEYLEDIKVGSLVLDMEMDSVSNVMEEIKPEISECAENQPKRKEMGKKSRRREKQPTLGDENTPIENVEPRESIEEIEAFSNRTSPMSDLESNSTSNDPIEKHENQCKSDRRIPKTYYKHANTSNDLRQKIYHYFKLNKTAIDAHRLLAHTYGKLSLTTCYKWYQRFKVGESNLNDKGRSGRPKKFRNIELEALLDENPIRTIHELSSILGVSPGTISRRLSVIGKVYENGKWIAKNGQSGHKMPTSRNVRQQILKTIRNRNIPPKTSWLCETCGKNFSRAERLRTHTLIHQNKMPYSCKTCKKGFRRRYNLRVHERVHTGDRPYKCKYCDYRCAAQSNMVKHIKQKHADKLNNTSVTDLYLNIKGQSN